MDFDYKKYRVLIERFLRKEDLREEKNKETKAAIKDAEIVGDFSLNLIERIKNGEGK